MAGWVACRKLGGQCKSVSELGTSPLDKSFSLLLGSGLTQGPPGGQRDRDPVLSWVVTHLSSSVWRFYFHSPPHLYPGLGRLRAAFRGYSQRFWIDFGESCMLGSAVSSDGRGGSDGHCVVSEGTPQAFGTALFCGHKFLPSISGRYFSLRCSLLTYSDHHLV